MTLISCPACGSQNHDDCGTYRYSSAILAGKTKRKCETCGLVFTSPMPGSDDWEEYNSNYFQSAHAGGDAAKNARAFRSGLAKIRAEHVRAYLEENAIKVDSVLEIGAGYGEFVAAFKNYYAQVSYNVLETDQSMHARLKAAGAFILDTPEALTAEVDLVIVSHVLEHTIDPLKFLQFCTNRLRQGGCIFVEVPCMDFTYKSTDEPHLLFFDKAPLEKLIAHVAPDNLYLSYHGRSRAKLQRENQQTGVVRMVEKLIRRGYRELSLPWRGLSRLEWAAVRPFEAQLMRSEPARWLRALGTK